MTGRKTGREGGERLAVIPAMGYNRPPMAARNSKRRQEQQPPPVETFLTIPETARLLRLSVRSVYRLAKDGKLPGAAQYGSQWRVRRDVLMDWAAKRGESSEGGNEGAK